MNRFRLYLHRLLRRPAITGPYPVYIRRIPTGVMLDVESYLTAMVVTLADNPGLLNLLDEIATDRAQAKEHDGWEPEQLLVEKLCTALGYELPVYGDAVARLADRLHAAVPAPSVVIPQQREAGAA